jgi:hypothetical protein
MMMIVFIKFIIFYLAVWGLTNILVKEYIFLWLRNYLDGLKIKSILNCETCTAFWVGALLSLVPNLITWDIDIYNTALLMGLSSSIIIKLLTIKIFTL